MYAYFDGISWIENVDARGMKNLAKIGVIRPDTMVRLPGGKEVSASEITALEFGELVEVSQEFEKYRPREPISKSDFTFKWPKTVLALWAIAGIVFLAGCYSITIATIVHPEIPKEYHVRFGVSLIAYSIGLVILTNIIAIFVKLLESISWKLTSIVNDVEVLEENIRNNSESS